MALSSRQSLNQSGSDGNTVHFDATVGGSTRPEPPKRRRFTSTKSAHHSLIVRGRDQRDGQRGHPQQGGKTRRSFMLYGALNYIHLFTSKVHYNLRVFSGTSAFL